MTAKTKLDIILIVVGLLLLATLVAFFIGLLPYPYGFIVLSIVFIARIMQIRGRD
jgi:hypothetical protein